MTKYTDAMLSELRGMGTLDLELAKEFAAKHGISYRSVIAKARALVLPYQAKAPGAKKDTDKGPAKADLVKRIENSFGISVPSMAKMTVQDLNKLVEALG